jgi:hypothetical protein
MPEETVISAVITVAVLAYMLTDKILFRAAMHVLVGVGATYVLAIAIERVLWPNIVLRLTMPGATDPIRDQVFALLAILGCVFLFAKVLKRAAWLGNMAVGYMIGVGAALALSGALFGTLAPQTLDAANLSGNLLANLLVLVSTLVVLVAFRYRRAAANSVSGYVARVGRVFLYVAFGATFALVFIANASVLVSLVQSIAAIFIRPPTG